MSYPPCDKVPLLGTDLCRDVSGITDLLCAREYRFSIPRGVNDCARRRETHFSFRAL